MTITPYDEERCDGCGRALVGEPAVVIDHGPAFLGHYHASCALEPAARVLKDPRTTAGQQTIALAALELYLASRRALAACVPQHGRAA